MADVLVISMHDLATLLGMVLVLSAALLIASAMSCDKS
jgi:hypothetical protein